MLLDDLLEHKKIFIVIISCILLFVIGLSTYLFYDYHKMNELGIENNKSTDQYNKLLSEYNGKNLKMFEDKMKETFTEEQLKSITQKYITEELYINNEKFSTSPIYIKADNTTVILSEIYDDTANEFLSENLLNIGSVFNIADPTTLLHISSNDAKVNTVIDNKEHSKSLTFNISKIKIGDIISIEINAAVAKSLGLEDTIIEIIYNGEK